MKPVRKAETNKSSQRTFDPPPIFAAAKTAAANTADSPQNLPVIRQGHGAFEVLHKLIIPSASMIYRKVIILVKLAC